eukprot:s2635_g8.t1
MLHVEIANHACKKKRPGGKRFSGTQWRRSLETLCTARQLGLEPNSFTGNAVVAALERGLQWQGALWYLQACEHGPCPDRITYNTVITALGRQSLWQEAIAMLKELSEQLLEPNAVSFNAAVAACASIQSLESWRMALDVLRIGAATSAAYPQLPGLSSGLSACARASRWHRALQGFQGMRRHGPAPDVAACGALLDAFDSAGQWQWSLWLLDQMLEGKKLPRPDLAAVTSVINACGMQIQWERALHLLRATSTTSLSPSAATYNAVAGACDRGLQPELTLEIVRELTEKQLQLDHISYLAAISACGKAQRWPEALLNFQQLLQRSMAVPQNVMNSAVSACEKGSCWLSATGLLDLEEQLMLPRNVVSISAVITSSASRHQWLPSMRLLQQMGSTQLRLDQVALHSFLDATEATAQWRVACSVLRELPLWRLQIGCIGLSAMAGSCDQAGRPVPGLLHQLEDKFIQEIADQSLSLAPSTLSHFFEAEELFRSSETITSFSHLLLGRAIYRPALVRLAALATRAPRATRPGELFVGQLWEPLLERQFSLGATFTGSVLQQLGLHALGAWTPSARLLPRRELRGEINQVPSAESLPGFLATAVGSGANTRGRSVGYGAAPEPELAGRLRPIFVQHDRSRHAERLALLTLIQQFAPVFGEMS